MYTFNSTHRHLLPWARGERKVIMSPLPKPRARHRRIRHTCTPDCFLLLKWDEMWGGDQAACAIYKKLLVLVLEVVRVTFSNPRIATSTACAFPRFCTFTIRLAASVFIGLLCIGVVTSVNHPKSLVSCASRQVYCIIYLMTCMFLLQC